MKKSWIRRFGNCENISRAGYMRPYHDFRQKASLFLQTFFLLKKNHIILTCSDENKSCLGFSRSNPRKSFHPLNFVDVNSMF